MQHAVYVYTSAEDIFIRECGHTARHILTIFSLFQNICHSNESSKSTLKCCGNYKIMIKMKIRQPESPRNTAAALAASAARSSSLLTAGTKVPLSVTVLGPETSKHCLCGKFPSDLDSFKNHTTWALLAFFHDILAEDSIFIFMSSTHFLASIIVGTEFCTES